MGVCMWGEDGQVGCGDFQGGQARNGEIMEVKGRVSMAVLGSLVKDKDVFIKRELVTSLRDAGGTKLHSVLEGGRLRNDQEPRKERGRVVPLNVRVGAAFACLHVHGRDAWGG